MYRIIRSTTYTTLLAELDQARAEAEVATDSAIRAEGAAECLADQLKRAKAEADAEFEGLRAILRQATAERDAARAECDAALAESEAARAQVLLDAEDRVALRALLRTARKQGDDRRVYGLFRRGALHSLHRSAAAAEAAAEAEGASRAGWTAHVPGAPLPPASEVLWRVQALSLSPI
ncbi:hypothetical protein AB0940_33470 [Streptomyces sp. NPDC006656]|uniref:hypothetical protein n=1 Tax=Streptomyces sp. NPDC006656 TaxID=3156899 RepID=UPI003453CB20